MKLKRQRYLKRMLRKKGNQHQCGEDCLIKLENFKRSMNGMSSKNHTV